MEVDDEELKTIKEKVSHGDSTVSSLVLQREERWSKEKLRKWVKEKKGKKLAEFVGLREEGKKRESVTRTRAKLSPSPTPSSSLNTSKKVHVCVLFCHCCCTILTSC